MADQAPETQDPTTQSRQTATEDSSMPPSIGPWRIIRVLGEGGFGIVYQAERSNPAQQAAIKLIKPGMGSRAVLARFDAERQALAMLTHPNIARLYEAGLHDGTGGGRPYFAMEFVPGEPITSYAERHKLSLTQRLQLFQQVCAAVQHAHLKTIIHRDISARNVLVTDIDGKPTAKVIDFGIAKAIGVALTDQTIDTGAGNIIGNYAYMSPEQAAGDADIDARTDVYSLGVLLYELLTGQRPFDNETIHRAGDLGIRKLIVETEPPRPSTLTSSSRELTTALRRELEWIPLMALRKDRTRRYQSPTDFAADIQNYLDNKPLTAGPESRVYRLKKFSGRNRVPLATTAAAIALTIGATAFYIRSIRTEQAKTAAALTLAAAEAVEKEKQRAEAASQRDEAGRQRDEAGRQRDEAAKQRDEAKKQTAIANAVSAFQTDMLATADPSKLLGDKVTVLQAVSAAIQELDTGKLKDRPLVEASVRLAIGSTLRSLARNADAEPNLRKALELREKHLPPDHPDIRPALDQLGENYLDINKLDKAEPLLKRSVEIAQRTFPPDPLAIGASLGRLANLRYHQDKLQEAEDLFRKSLAIGRASLAADDPALASKLVNLAFILTAQSKLPEAEALYRECLTIRRKSLPPGHPDTAAVLNKLALLLNDLDKPAEAEPFLRESLDISRRAYPESHPEIGIALTSLANFLQSQDRLTDAEPLYRQALDIYRKSLPTDHPYIATALANLGSIRQSLGQLTQAEADLRQALEILHRIYPNGHSDLAATTHLLASVLWDQQKLPETEQLLREALTMARKVLAPDHLFTATVISDLGFFFDSNNRPTEAEPLYREALSMRRRLLPPDHPELNKSRNNLAVRLQYQNNLPEAESLFRESLTVLRKASPPNPSDTGAVLNRIAVILKDTNRPVDALPLFEESLALRESIHGPTHATTCRTVFYLADTLDQLNRPDEAQALRLKYRLGDPATRPAPATQPGPTTQP